MGYYDEDGLYYDDDWYGPDDDYEDEWDDEYDYDPMTNYWHKDDEDDDD